MIASDCSAAQAETPQPRRLLATWQLVEADGLGSTYYFYPDGLLVIQNPRRREFVVLARWHMEGPKTLMLSDYRPLSTTLSRAQLAEQRKGKYRWTILSIGTRKMRWESVDSPGKSDVFQRRGHLPDRTENVYWGLGTDESYARGIRKQMER